MVPALLAQWTAHALSQPPLQRSNGVLYGSGASPPVDGACVLSPILYGSSAPSTNVYPAFICNCPTSECGNCTLAQEYRYHKLFV